MPPGLDRRSSIAVIVLFLIFTYNGLVRLRNMVDEAWNQISVQLKRRHDLIPNLVNAVKGYMEFEQETLTGSSRRGPPPWPRRRAVRPMPGRPRRQRTSSPAPCDSCSPSSKTTPI